MNSFKTGTMSLPLHGGKAPAWLFSRMRKLSREILLLMASEFGPNTILEKLSDPLWFQALGCVLGFDWHSSGVTTTVCGALKEAVKGIERDTGLYIAGGKGATSRKTPSEIEKVQEITGNNLENLVYYSRMSAKVDSNALQDGYQLYHHCFFFTPDGKKWAVVQQGMNDTNKLARRYHWLGERVTDFVCEPHSAICCDNRSNVLNLIAEESSSSRDTIAQLANHNPASVLNDFMLIKKHEEKHFSLPSRHAIYSTDIDTKRFEKILLSTYEIKPENFEKLLAIPGVGPRTIRSLAMISELIYGVRYSINDPARFGFAHGGKDGIPYPVDKKTYDLSIDILNRAVKEAKIDRTDKINALRRLSIFYNNR
jgi:uncharacterized protein